MSAPRDIVDALECVLSVYFSGVRHNLRAAFILCDEAVEVTMRARIKAAVPTLGKMSFPQLCDHAESGLAYRTHALGKKLYATHTTRNNMQHSNAAATVDAQHCADAILDAVECIEHCFPGAKAAFEDKIKVALRVVRVYSAQGTGTHRTQFQDGMSRHPWRTQQRQPRVHETIVQPGLRSHWGLVIMAEVAEIETILNRIGAP
jgi:hypothetical protein